MSHAGRMITLTLLVSGLAGTAPAAEAFHGVVIDRSPDAATQYVGCPAITILPEGGYLAAHSWFGPGTTNDTTEVFR